MERAMTERATLSDNPGSGTPRATYRLQLDSRLGFTEVRRLLSYFDRLGISHLYTSPFLEARSGSPHGYDVTDHNAFNPELGSEADFDELAAGLASRDMGLILDFVANHMGVGKADNNRWQDVLEWGEASPFAGFFDIDWHSPNALLRGKVLLPFLGQSYGKVLEGGELQLGFDASQGSFAVSYFDHLFPVAPRHYARILSGVSSNILSGSARSELAELSAAFRTLRTAGLSGRRQREVRQRAEALKEQLASLAQGMPEVKEQIERAVALHNGGPGQHANCLRLHRLLQKQAYRLSWWRVASDNINYRRFFDINDLVTIRTERAEVFDNIHRLVLRLIAEGKLHGLRIDHIDGLSDPRHYCEKLRNAAASRESGGDSLYLVVEKILAHGEVLRTDWPVAGTTGYEVLNRINSLFVEPASENVLQTFYHQLTGMGESFDETLASAKRQVIDHLLASDIQVLSNLFSRLAESNWHTRDFTLASLRRALAEIIVSLPVYRTYVDPRGCGASDRHEIHQAISSTKKRNPLINNELLDFIRGVLTTDLARSRSGFNRNQVIRIAMKFQQYSGPIMAKSLEDTAFYRHMVLASLNEVGGDPRHFGTSMEDFHRFIDERGKQWPHAMITTATHDSKRGEDVRARLNALTEIPELWRRKVEEWISLNGCHRVSVDAVDAPVRNDEYLLYQTLAGSIPMEWVGSASYDSSFPDTAALDDYRQRIEGYMIKAVREAKLNSSWAHPNQTYEEALSSFVSGILEPGGVFLKSLLEFMQVLGPLGALNGLAQTALKFTLPGVPDLYQGTELWDLNLVDPDNRRPVDYGVREQMLRQLSESADGNRDGLVAELANGWPDGRIKLYVTWQLLELRRRHPGLFLHGSYEPVHIHGDNSHGLCAFARHYHDQCLLTVVPCLCKTGAAKAGRLTAAGLYEGAGVSLKAVNDHQQWHNLFTGDQITAEANGELAVSDLLAKFPVAVLHSGIPFYE
ncbi:malto-oligosyltrehalose synthase [Marinobacter vulgaris]|uniref:Malto-oligosyltrehalose synthase n=2 Tax=Marinobacter vulgaris TaxID=1928331 RepID=A0A2V3ZJV9_9GAMM|nr:malto-oligosyltrehalose synthase [Marinobacter vulgaris]TSJ70219.1 malto-oligosyltrehalose synthase [Marinobacter vulgaris]